MDQTNMAELQELREKLMLSEKLMTEASCSWQEKLAQTEARKREEMDELKVSVCAYSHRTSWTLFELASLTNYLLPSPSPKGKCHLS